MRSRDIEKSLHCSWKVHQDTWRAKVNRKAFWKSLEIHSPELLVVQVIHARAKRRGRYERARGTLFGTKIVARTNVVRAIFADSSRGEIRIGN